MSQSESKPRILFVDDEPDVLAGIRQVLRKERHRWEMSFAGGGEEALALFDASPFDVVVTDMRMPGMDGAALLEHVTKKHPETLRFVLSGEASEALSMRAIPFTHQWIAKPCQRDEIVETVERSLAVFVHLTSRNIRQLVGGAGHLPSAPVAYAELLKALKDPDVDFTVLASRIEADPALTARVLQLTNSSFFGIRQSVTRVRDAIATIGLRLLADMVLATEIFEAWKTSTPVGSRGPEAVQRHSLAVVRLACQIGAQVDLDPAQLVTAALLHDVGALVLDSKMPEVMRRLDKERGTRAWWRVEEEELGWSHADIGGALLQSWGLPWPLVEVATFHHQPSLAHADRFDQLGAVHVANCLVEGLEPDWEFLQSVGMEERWPEWQKLYEGDGEQGQAA